DWLDKEVIEPARALADAEDRLRWIIQHHGQRLCQGSRDIPLLTEEVSSLEPKHRQLILKRKRRYFEFVRATLHELEVQGKLREVDTTVAAFGLFGMLLWLPRWYQPGGRLTVNRTMTELLNLYLNGVMACKQRAPAQKTEKRIARRNSRS